jgi:manganese transport protein
MGPATLVSVGYIDPGNWATDLEGGARFGYSLLWVLVASSFAATLLQTLSARLGLVSGHDLASACRMHYSPWVSRALWVLAELALIACDLAEILGSAIAIQLLFGLPLVAGSLLTVFDVFIILALQRRGMRWLESIVLALLSTIAGCLVLELFFARPPARSLAGGLVPHLQGESLYLAVGILGATVMPHNLYLHSSLVRKQTRGARSELPRALRQSFFSTAIALNLALLLNAAILILSAAVFSSRGIGINDLREAHRLLTPIVGTSVSATLFAVALLCSGQSATISGTLAGQYVLEGFVRIRLSPVIRRSVTRALAVAPAVGVLAIAGESGTVNLLIASQVVLSLQLPFAIIPLLRMTNSVELMGRFQNSRLGRWAAAGCAAVVIAANAWLVARTVHDLQAQHPALALLLAAASLAGSGLLAWIGMVPLALPSQGTLLPRRRDADEFAASPLVTARK